MIAEAPLEAGCTRIDVSALGYDAAGPTRGKRKAPSTRLMSEDNVLNKSKRKKTVSAGQDMFRNFSLVAWMVRRHLDYVTKFTLQVNINTPDKEYNKALNKQIEKEVKKRMKKDRFDIAHRHNLNRFVRIMETRSIIDNDFGIARFGTGHVQGLEGDRIQDPPEINKGELWTQGVRTNAQGAALQYGIYNRGKSGKGYEFARRIGYQNFWLHGNFDRIDQFRGISPFTAAINSAQDVYEGVDLSLAKLKVEQLFCMAIFRDASQKAGGLPTVDENGNVSEEDQTGYDVNFDAGPILLDMDPGESAQFLQSSAPGANTVDFINAVIGITLKSLDIPYSFYDESFTNFFGSRAAWLHYERGCRDKRDRIREFLDWWVQWTLMRLILDGTIKLPAGMTLEDEFWEWVPDGMPWWDPVKEINGDNLAIKAGFTSPQKVCKERGKGDYYDNIDQTIEAYKYAKDNGFEPDWSPFQESVISVGG